MAPEILGPVDRLTRLRMGEGEGFTPQAQNLPCYFRQQAYIKQTHGGGDDSYRHLGEALATNQDQLS